MIIYKITNLVNKKIYIGQTKNSLKERWKQHCDAAKHEKRHKGVLRLAINKYGKENFKMEEIDLAGSQAELDLKEWFFAEMFNSYAPHGYNLAECGKSKKISPVTIDKFMAKEYTFLSPDNQIHKIKNLSKFCGENGLRSCHMYRVVTGERESHLGWRSLKRNNKVYVVKNLETGKVYNMLACYGFRRKIGKILNMNNTEISNLISGRNKTVKGNVLLEIKTF